MSIKTSFLFFLITVTIISLASDCSAQTGFVLNEAARGFFDKIISVYKNLYAKAYQNVWLKYLEPDLGGSVQTLKENIKQGIAEERGEMSSGFKDLISKVWNFFLNMTKKSQT